MGDTRRRAVTVSLGVAEVVPVPGAAASTAAVAVGAFPVAVPPTAGEIPPPRPVALPRPRVAQGVVGLFGLVRPVVRPPSGVPPSVAQEERALAMPPRRRRPAPHCQSGRVREARSRGFPPREPSV